MTRLTPVLFLLAFATSALAGPPTVALDEPAPGATITRVTVDVRVRIEGAEGEVAAAILCSPRWKGDEPKALLLVRQADGRWGVDDVPTERLAGGRIAVRAGGQGRLVDFDFVDRSGWAESSMLASGAPLDPLAARDLAGAPVELTPATRRPTLVFFYSAADDCEVELAFLRAVRKRWPALTIIGVGSVPPEGVEAWRRWLADRAVDWTNVADTDGALERAFYVRRNALGNATPGPVFYHVVDGAVRGSDYFGSEDLFDETGGLRVGMVVTTLIEDLGP